MAVQEYKGKLKEWWGLNLEESLELFHRLNEEGPRPRRFRESDGSYMVRGRMETKKVSELEGRDLDYWALKALGYDPEWESGAWYIADPEVGIIAMRPSSHWLDCGFLFREYEASLLPNGLFPWDCVIGPVSEEGGDPKEAFCRALVASVFGEEVECGEKDYE